MNWELIISSSSTIIALSALIFSIASFKKQQERAHKHEQAIVKPLLSIRSQNLLKLKSIRLTNFGVGPAVITKAEFRRNLSDEPTNSIVDLFNLECKIWDTYLNVVEKRSIPPEGEMVLLKQTLELVVSQGVSEDKAYSILKEWKKQKSGILVHIEYTDIYGNKMDPLNEKLN